MVSPLPLHPQTTAAHTSCGTQFKRALFISCWCRLPTNRLQGPSHSQTRDVVTVCPHKCNSGPKLSTGRMSNMPQGKNLSAGNCSERCPQRRQWFHQPRNSACHPLPAPAEAGTSIPTGSDSEAEHPSYLCITSV